MAASLVLALITIAGLGILALCLIFFGGSKKQQARYAKDKTVKQKEEKINPVKAAGNLQQHKEPYISDDHLSLAADKVTGKANLKGHKQIDPAITSLGFNALNDLLPEAENKTANKSSGITNASTTVTPIEFNAAPKKKNMTQDVIALHVMARDNKPFVGYELLQSVTAAGLRFGKMDIFHYQDENAPEKILFSLCSAVEPGSFNIASMGALVCPGLCLFMRISATENPKAVFNLMLEVAGQLADDLVGYVCDDKRQPLTDEKLHEYLLLAAQRHEYA